MNLTARHIQSLAEECGFEISGVTPASPHSDFSRFQAWCESGKAAEMSYLTDYRAGLRGDPRSLLPGAKNVICLGKLYNTDKPLSIEPRDAAEGWISRYAWGLDYHEVLRKPMQMLLERLEKAAGRTFERKICIDSAPLLERSYARLAGLGWIGKNTCLINERFGSWFFLAEILVDLEIDTDLDVQPFRCGSCTRCIQACPTHAILPHPDSGFQIDAGLCLSYLTIEKRGEIASNLQPQMGTNVFGCDICQDVCPWNDRARRADLSFSAEQSFASLIYAPQLSELADLSEDDFRDWFRKSPIWRAKYAGFLRNVAIAIGNSGNRDLREPLRRLTLHAEETVSHCAREALARLDEQLSWETT